MIYSTFLSELSPNNSELAATQEVIIDEIQLIAQTHGEILEDEPFLN
jgi:hypothetical protein